MGLGVLVCAAAGAGCVVEDTEVHPVWPAPPAVARIIHLKNIRTGSDLVQASGLDAVIRALTGGQEFGLLRPHGVAVWEEKYLYISDQEQQAVVVFNLESGEPFLIEKVGETFLVSPVGVAACGELVAVSDSALNGVFLLTPKGELVKTIRKPGGFERPTGLAYDAARGLLYVVDTLANEICVFDLEANDLVGYVGSRGQARGEFNYPTHIFLDRNGRLYVTDSLNFRVQVFNPQGQYLFHIGELGDASGHLAVPKGVGVDAEGHIYVVDSYFSRVQIFDEEGTFLLAVGEPGAGPGGFLVPSGLTVDSQDRIYVCDSYNKRVQLLQFVRASDHEDLVEAP